MDVDSRAAIASQGSFAMFSALQSWAYGAQFGPAFVHTEKEKTPLEKAEITFQDVVKMANRFSSDIAESFNKGSAFHRFQDSLYVNKAMLAKKDIENLINTCEIGKEPRFAADDEERKLVAENKIYVTKDCSVIISDNPSDWDMSPEETMSFVIGRLFENKNIRNEFVDRVLKTVRPDVELDRLTAEERADVYRKLSDALREAACAQISIEVVKSFEEDAVTYREINQKEKEGTLKNEKDKVILEYDEAYKEAYNIALYVGVNSSMDAGAVKKARKETIDILNSLKEAASVIKRCNFSKEDIAVLMGKDEEGEEFKRLVKLLMDNKFTTKEQDAITFLSNKVVDMEFSKEALVEYLDKHHSEISINNLEKEISAMSSGKIDERAMRPAQFWDAEKFFPAIEKMIYLEEKFGGRRMDGTEIPANLPKGKTSFDLLKSVLDVDMPEGSYGKQFQAEAFLRMIDLSCSRNESVRRSAYKYLKDYDKDKIKSLCILTGENPEKGITKGVDAPEFDADYPYLNIRRSVVQNPPLSAAYDLEKKARANLGNEVMLKKLEGLALALEVKTTYYSKVRSKDLPGLNERYTKWCKNIDKEYKPGDWKSPKEYLKDCLDNADKGKESKSPLFKAYKEFCDDISKELKGLDPLNRNDLITIFNYQYIFENMQIDVNRELIGKEFKITESEFRSRYGMKIDLAKKYHENGKTSANGTDDIGYLGENDSASGNVLFYTPYIKGHNSDNLPHKPEFYELLAKGPDEIAEEISDIILDLQYEIKHHRDEDDYFIRLNIPGNPYNGQVPAKITDINVNKDPTKGVGCLIGNNKYITNGSSTTIERYNNEPIPYNTYLTMAMIAKNEGCGLVVIHTNDKEELYRAALALAVNGLDFECDDVALSAEQALALDKIRDNVRDKMSDEERGAIQDTNNAVYQYVKDKHDKFQNGMEVITCNHKDSLAELNDLDKGYNDKLVTIGKMEHMSDQDLKTVFREFYLQDKDRFSYLSNDEAWLKETKDPEAQRAQVFANRFKSKPTDEDLKVVSEFIKENPKDALAFIVAQVANDKKLDACLLRWQVDNTQQWAEAKRELKDKYGKETIISQGEVLAHLFMNKDFSDKDIEDVSKALFGDKKAFAATIINILDGKEVSEKDMTKFIDSLNPKDLAMLAKECYRLDRKVLPKEELSWENRSTVEAPELEQADAFVDKMLADLRKKDGADIENGMIFDQVANYLTEKNFSEKDKSYQEVVRALAKEELESDSKALDLTTNGKLYVLELDKYKSFFGEKERAAIQNYVTGKVNKDELTVAGKRAVVSILQKVKSGDIKMEHLENGTVDEIKEEFDKYLAREEAEQAVLMDIVKTAKKYVDTIGTSDKYQESKDLFAEAIIKFQIDYINNPDDVIQQLRNSGYKKTLLGKDNVADKVDNISKIVNNIVNKKNKEAITIEDTNSGMNLWDVYVLASCYSYGKIVPIKEVIKDRESQLEDGLKDVKKLLESTYEKNSEVGMYISVVYASVADKMVSGDKNEVIGDIITGSLLDKINAEAEKKLKGFGILKDGENLKSLESLDESKIDISAVRAAIVGADEFKDYKGSGLSDEQKLKEIQKKLNKSKQQLDNVDKTIVQTISQNRAH